MTITTDLFPETLLVSRSGDRIYTTSLKVAEFFHKRHKNVLRDIVRLIEDLGHLECVHPDFRAGEGFAGLNFEPSTYLDPTGRALPMYLLSEEGFALLTMGFTGLDALAWKVKFLAAFRDMERQLAALREREANALYAIRPRWKPIAAHPELSRSQLIGLTGHRSPNSITACRRRMRDAGLI